VVEREGVENIRRVNKRLKRGTFLACILWRRSEVVAGALRRLRRPSMFLCISANPAIDKRLRVLNCG